MKTAMKYIKIQYHSSSIKKNIDHRAISSESNIFVDEGNKKYSKSCLGCIQSKNWFNSNVFRHRKHIMAYNIHE